MFYPAVDRMELSLLEDEVALGRLSAMQLFTRMRTLITMEPQFGREWQPMETAPQDRRILLKRPRNGVGFGRYDAQPYNKNPKPYWADERRHLGVRDCQEDSPTGWMLPPAIPESNPVKEHHAQ